MDEVGRALCEGAGGVSRLRIDHDEDQRDRFFSLWCRFFIGKVSKHPDEALVKVLRVGTVDFSLAVAAFQKVGIDYSTPLHCNQVILELV